MLTQHLYHALDVGPAVLLEELIQETKAANQHGVAFLFVGVDERDGVGGG